MYELCRDGDMGRSGNPTAILAPVRVPSPSAVFRTMSGPFRSLSGLRFAMGVLLALLAIAGEASACPEYFSRGRESCPACNSCLRLAPSERPPNHRSRVPATNSDTFGRLRVECGWPRNHSTIASRLSGPPGTLCGVLRI
jgi:hypothetical protein